MLGLIDFIGWVVAIVFFAGGIICTIGDFLDGDGLEIFLGIVSIIAGIIVFIVVYNWLESIGVCLFATGLVMCIISLAAQNTPSNSGSTTQAPKSSGGFIDELQKEYWEREKIASAVEKGIRNSRD